MVQNCTAQSKDRFILWSTEPPQFHERVRCENVLSGKVGITRYATCRIRDDFEVLFIRSMLKIVIEKTNIEGSRVFRDDLKTVDYISVEIAH